MAVEPGGGAEQETGDAADVGGRHGEADSGLRDQGQSGGTGAVIEDGQAGSVGWAAQPSAGGAARIGVEKKPEGFTETEAAEKAEHRIAAGFKQTGERNFGEAGDAVQSSEVGQDDVEAFLERAGLFDGDRKSTRLNS